MFQFDKKALLTFTKKIEKASKQSVKGIMYTLNDIAFGTRHVVIENIERQMVVRNKPFIHSRIAVQMAKASKPTASVGLLETKRFSLREQEFGGPSENLKGRHINLSARGNRIAKKVKTIARLKRENRFYKPSDYRGRSRSGRGMPSGIENKTIGMLRSLSRIGYKKPFILPDTLKTEHGLYMFKGRTNRQKLIQLQSFKHITYARRRPWLSSAPPIYFRRVDKRRLIGSNIGKRIKLK